MTSAGQQLAEQALRLQAYIADVGSDQWRAGVTPVPREDTTERAKGLVSDPTPSIVADQRRQQLRQNVLEAEAFMLKAAKHLSAMTAHLDTNYQKWLGQ